MTHYDLCKKTAEKFVKQSRIVLYEYQSYATKEFPDVLCFKDVKTILFEIKVNYIDFKKDFLKECRSKIRIKYMPEYRWRNDKLKSVEWRNFGFQEFIMEAPHLGRKRYYVCPEGMIQDTEIKNEWGLYWYCDGKFKLKKESKIFRHNIYDEMRILEHAFRKYYCGDGTNILINGYK